MQEQDATLELKLTKSDATYIASLVGIGLLMIGSDTALRDRGRAVIKLDRQRADFFSQLILPLYGTETADEIDQMDEESRMASLEYAARRARDVQGRLIGWLARLRGENLDEGTGTGPIQGVVSPS